MVQERQEPAEVRLLQDAGLPCMSREKTAKILKKARNEAFSLHFLLFWGGDGWLRFGG